MGRTNRPVNILGLLPYNSSATATRDGWYLNRFIPFFPFFGFLNSSNPNGGNHIGGGGLLGGGGVGVIQSYFCLDINTTS